MSTIYIPFVSRSHKLDPVFGVEVDGVISDPTWEMPFVVPGGVLKLNCWWSKSEVVEGTIAYEQRFLNQMAALPSDTYLIMSVKAMPDWARASGVPTCGPILESKIPALCNFIAKLLQDYPQIKAIEFGNEASAPVELFSESEECGQYGCWGSNVNPYSAGRYYGQVAQSIGETIRPGVLLVGCALGFLGEQYDLPFLRGALETCNQFDAISFHRYIYSGSEPDWLIKFLENIQILRSITNLPLWLTETNWQSQTPNDPVSMQKQANYIQWIANSNLGLGKIIIYSMISDWVGCNLINGNGTKRPAWYEYEKGVS